MSGLIISGDQLREIDHVSSKLTLYDTLNTHNSTYEIQLVCLLWLICFKLILSPVTSTVWLLITPTDLKVQLQATDYGNFLQNEPSPIPVSVIDEKLRNHLVVEFQHMRNQSVEPLSNFLDYIT